MYFKLCTYMNFYLLYLYFFEREKYNDKRPKEWLSRSMCDTVAWGPCFCIHEDSGSKCQDNSIVSPQQDFVLRRLQLYLFEGLNSSIACLIINSNILIFTSKWDLNYIGILLSKSVNKLLKCVSGSQLVAQQGVLLIVMLLSRFAIAPPFRCPRCPGSVEIPPCSSRSRGSAPCAWKFARSSTLTCRDTWRGRLLRTGTTSGTRSGASANRTMPLFSLAGQKAAAWKRSAHLLTRHRPLCSGTRPSDIENMLVLPCPEAPDHPSPHSPVLCRCSRAWSGVSGQPISSRGMILADVKDNGCYHSNIFACSGCHVFLSSLVIFDIFIFPVIEFL